MENINRYAGLPARTIRRIRYLAKKLTRQNAVPGMEREDYEQDLVLDLLKRIGRHDPTRASLETFAERIIDNRVATLTRPCARLQAERRQVSLDAVLAPEDDQQSAHHVGDLAESPMGGVEEDAADVESRLGLRFDLERFVGNLPPALRMCVDVLRADSISGGAQSAGLHRSTIYERLSRLRAEAAAIGLQEYLGFDPTLRPSRR